MLTRVRSLARASNGTHWLIVGNALVAAVGAAQAVVVARTLGPTEFGRVALAVAVPQLAFGLAQPRTTHALLRLLARSVSAEPEPRLAAAFVRLALMLETAAAATAVVGCAIWFAVAPPGRSGDLLRPVLLYSASLVARAAVPPLKTTLLAIDADRFSSLLDVGFGVLQLAFGAIGALWTGDASGYLLGSAAGNVVGAVFYAGFAFGRRRQDRRTLSPLALVDLRTAWRDTRRFILGSSISSSVSATITSGDVLLLSRYLGPQAIGNYRIASRAGDGMVLLTGPLSSAALRTLGALAPGDRLGVRRLVRSWAIRRSLPALLLVALAALAVRPLFSLALGAEFAPAATAAALFVVASGCWLVGYWVRPAYLVLDRPLLHLVLFVVSVVASLPLLPLLSERHGVTGAAGWFLVWNGLQLVLTVAVLAWLLRGRDAAS